MKNTVLKVLVILVALELVLTGFISFESATSIGGFCIAGNASSCESIQNSQYGKIFGLRLGYFGFVSFLILSAVLIRDFRNKKISGLFVGLSFLGACFASYFIYLQVFVLKQICSTCVVVDGTAILIFFLSLAGKKFAPLV